MYFSCVKYQALFFPIECRCVERISIETKQQSKELGDAYVYLLFRLVVLGYVVLWVFLVFGWRFAFP